MNVIKIDKAYIEKDGEKITVLPNENICQSMEKIPECLDFIKKLTSLTHKPDFVASREEYEYLVYYSFLYFLVNWDSLLCSKQIVWQVWSNFKKHINELLNDEENKKVVLDYKYGDIYVFKEYIERKFGDINLSVINRNKIIR